MLSRRRKDGCVVKRRHAHRTAARPTDSLGHVGAGRVEVEHRASVPFFRNDCSVRPQGSEPGRPGDRRHLLADEAAALALPPGVGVLGEKQLGPVQNVHQHGQLGLDQGPQPVLQRRHDVLERSTAW